MKSGNTRGLGFLGTLGAIFVVLKLLNLISWPWKWVLLPFWGSAIIGIIALIVILILLRK